MNLNTLTKNQETTVEGLRLPPELRSLLLLAKECRRDWKRTLTLSSRPSLIVEGQGIISRAWTLEKERDILLSRLPLHITPDLYEIATRYITQLYR